MKLKYLLLLAPFGLIACGEPQPHEDELSDRFSEKYDELALESISLKKNEVQGPITIYTAEGEFKTKESLYNRLASVTNKITLYKEIEKKGKEYDFTATVIALGNDKTGWEIDFADLHSKLPDYSTSESKLAKDEDINLIVNADNFKEQLNKAKADVENLKSKLPTLEAQLAAYEKQSKELNNQMNAFWTNIEIDGQKFTTRYDLSVYLGKEASEYHEENNLYSFYEKYDSNGYTKKRVDLYNKYKNFDNAEMQKLDGDREKAKEAHMAVYEKEYARLKQVAEAKLKVYEDQVDAIRTQESETRKKASDLRSEISSMKYEIDNFENGIKKAVEDGHMTL